MGAKKEVLHLKAPPVPWSFWEKSPSLQVSTAYSRLGWAGPWPLFGNSPKVRWAEMVLLALACLCLLIHPSAPWEPLPWAPRPS